jgi:hypothetical protein
MPAARTGSWIKKAMMEYTRRADFRKHFQHPTNRNHLPGAVITAVRRVGPHWIIAGRRPRSIPVFRVQTILLCRAEAPA